MCFLVFQQHELAGEAFVACLTFKHLVVGVTANVAHHTVFLIQMLVAVLAVPASVVF